MKTNKAERRKQLYNRLASLGFTIREAEQLRRIEMTLHRWAEHECGDSNDRFSTMIERDEKTDKPFWCVSWHNENKTRRTPCPDRERGALNRLGKIVGDCNTRNWIGYGKCITEMPAFLVAYHQGDPRGCALYIGLKSDLDGKPIDSCYSRLVAVCD